MKLYKNKGFTLVELIVVIVILGILAVIAVPKFMNMKVEAKNAALQGLAASLKSATAEFHAKAVMAGADLNRRNYNYASGNYDFFDYKTGHFYNYDSDNGTNRYTEEQNCKDSPSCTPIGNGYPRGSFVYPNIFVNGVGQAPFGINRLIDSDAKFTTLVAISTSTEIFYFTEDQAVADYGHFAEAYSYHYPTSMPCSVTYIPGVSYDYVINIGKYNPTTKQFDDTGKTIIQPGDGVPRVYINPCTK